MDQLALSQLIIDRVRRTERGRNNRYVLAIAGFPFVGKTTLAGLISNAFGAPVCILPTESYIASRAERAELGLDGCAIAAHDMARARKDLETLRSGLQVQVHCYDWRAGAPNAERLSLRVPEGGLLIVDGTVAMAAEFQSLVDLTVVLRPSPYQDWLAQAARRDHDERYWGADDAVEYNTRKYQTSSSLLPPRSSRVMYVSVVMPGHPYSNFAYDVE